MNINFQNITGRKTSQDSILSSMEAEGKIVSGPSKAGAVSKTGYALDIDATGFTDNAYAEQSRGKEDIVKEAEDTDVQLRHNYMALLSNTMSDEDYAKAMEDGFDIKNMDCEETVSIVDKIKSVLLQSGQVIEGYNDDISPEKLRKITGSESFANALMDSFNENDVPITNENVKAASIAYEQIKDVNSLEDSTLKYMTLNNMEPTIENVYLAAHSTNGINVSGRGFYAQESGYYAQKADTYDWKQLEPQIERVISEAGLDPRNESYKDNSKWMVEQGIPLTKENLEKVNVLKSMDFPVTEKRGAEAIASAIADGRRAVEGNLFDPRSDLKKASDLVDIVNNITDEDVKETIISGNELTIKNLTTKKDFGNNLVQIPSDNDPKLVTARLQLEEVRLKMTTEANKQLLESGFSIDTAPMEDLIERLKNTLSLMGDESAGKAIDEITDITPSNSGLIASFTFTRVSMIAQGPVDIVGEMAGEFKSATLMAISERSESMAERFKQAGEGYEKLLTSPREDLGDSIKKAFRNVDDILKDLNMDVTSENERAVRILGYNKMTISPENIEKIRAWDQKLQVTIERLKPGAVLDLIRNGKNPLSMTVEELSDNLDQNKSSDDRGRKEEEKFSRFLYKLEHKGEITEAEKTSFIGIYRLFHTLKNTDYQAIGSLLKTDQDMTIGNLLNATRNQKTAKRGMDITVDDSFQGVEMVAGGSPRIDEQINTAFIYYRAKAEMVYENLEPEKLLSAAPTVQTLLPELADDLRKAESDRELDRAYANEQMRHVREVASNKAAEPAIEDLVNMELELNFNNLEAQINLRRERRKGNLWEKTRDYRENALLSEKLDEDDYEENYVKLLDDLSDKLSEELNTDTDSYIDVRAISLMQKQLSVMKKSAESGSFEVPVEIEGQKVSMHVTLRSEEGANTRMDAGVQTDEYGYITLSIYGEGENIRGMLTTTYGQNDYESEYLEKVRTGLCERISERHGNLSIGTEDISLLYRAQNGPASVGVVNTNAKDGGVVSPIETRTLLTMAKAFVEAL